MVGYQDLVSCSN